MEKALWNPRPLLPGTSPLVPGNLSLERCVRTTFLPLAAPSSPPAPRQPYGTTKRLPLKQGPEPLGSWSGSRSGTKCSESVEPQGTPAPGSLQDLPTPTPHSLRAAGCPRALPSEGTRPILALSRTLLIAGQRIPLQRESLAAKTGAAGTYPGRSAATPRTLPRLPPPGRDTPPLMSRLPRDVPAARRTRSPRSSGSGLTGSGELDSARAAA